ncbi:aldehyde dehydrogenase family protein [Streptosporangium sp. NPDC001681]|uniref:aldehyde dehydrogenase family protein n=1 Tax=Streptosporangium sp. NPDC001681 TaxID=3154395 RepID=UPI0033193DD4
MDVESVIAELGGAPRRLLIDGRWVPAVSEKTFDTINPSTGAVIASVAEGDAEDIDLAVAAARRALEGPWRRFTPVQRQNILLRFAELVEKHIDELALLNVIDMGVPYSWQMGTTRGGVKPGNPVETIRYFAGWATKLHGETVQNSLSTPLHSLTLREPVGVVGAIIPWNSPLAAPVWKIAPVLATGCTIVLKPAEEAPLTPLRLGELLQELDLPPGVVNVVTGYGETAGARLAAHPDVNKIGFTGSTATGREIIRASAVNMKRVHVELGGKSPDIVFADADLDVAIPGAAMGIFANNGQVCSAGSRIFVQRPVYEEFVSRFAEEAARLKVGDALDPDTEIGPIVSRAQLDRVAGYLESGPAEGARVVAGGHRVEDGELAKGNFVAPTVFADVRDEMRIAREEIFGPVASVLPFDTVDEVIRRANATEYGLAAGVWTRDVGRAHKMIDALQAGNVYVNTWGQVDPSMPFGGLKTSGYGNELSGHVLHEYLNTKAVWIRVDD